METIIIELIANWILVFAAMYKSKCKIFDRVWWIKVILIAIGVTLAQSIKLK